MNVSYVLFTHLFTTERADLESFEAGQPLAGVDRLMEFAPRLRELLCDAERPGMLLIFFASGWSSRLRQLHMSGLPYGRARQKMDFSREFARQVQARMAGFDADLGRRVQVITADDLLSLVARNERSLTSFKYFVGQAIRPAYDSPKLVEAIVRLRNQEAGVPVFRLDEDVVLNDHTKREPALGLGDPVARSLKLFQQTRDRSYAMWSSSYRWSGALDSSDLEPWATAFATRVFPAIDASQAGVSDLNNLRFNVDQARRFYGLEGGAGTWVVNGGLADYGAHPTNSIISGAMLYLSPSAVFALPPFSNFTSFVSWIDDHLKYQLHRTLGHFEGPAHRVWSGQQPEVHKGRAQALLPDIGSYLYGRYLPVMLRGCILDGWIEITRDTKYDADQLRAINRPQSPASFPGAFTESLRTAWQRHAFSLADRQALGDELRVQALTRLAEVARAWSGLKGSFADHWFRGLAPASLVAQSPIAVGPLIGEAAAGAYETRPLTHEDLSRPMVHTLDELVDNAIGYVDWMLEWPSFAHALKGPPPGSFPGDVS